MRNNIVRYNGRLGEVIFKGNKQDGEARFRPADDRGTYSFSDLEVIVDAPNTVTLPSSEDCVDFLKERFVWGTILRVYTIAEYTIFRYRSNHTSEVSYHAYIDNCDTNTSYDTLDLAIIGCIALKYEGLNSQATKYIGKMLDMFPKEKEK